MNLDPRTRARLIALRRWLLVLATGGLIWTVYLHLGGGFGVTIGSLRVSSHNPRTALLITVASLILAIVVCWRLGDLTPWREWRSRLRPVLAAIASIDARVPFGTLVAVAIAAAVVDLHQLFGAAPLWLDEEMIALNFRDRSFSELAGPLWLEQSAPYGWLVVERAVLLTLGASERALRLVPTLFGIATYVAALWIARRWLTWLAGFALLLLCVLSPWLSHFRVEVKHYSADAFWALLLPALAVWSSEAPTAVGRQRRAIVWWMTAAAALWLANGAVLVAPVSVLAGVMAVQRHDGLRAALRYAAWGVIWALSFALHYAISLQYTAYLRRYWAAEFPPTAAGFRATIGWFAGRLDRIAADVAGSDAGVIFWMLAALGFAWTARHALAAVYAGVVLSGFVLATLHLVPMFDRFSLWMVPALYIGIALSIDRASRTASHALRSADWVRAGASLAIASATLLVCAGILQRGAGRLHREPPTSKQGSDDRTGVGWLMERRQPGDALLSTPLGLPAVWWYGKVSIAGDFAARQQSVPMYEVENRPAGSGCGLPAALTRHPRVLVYIGFPDMPKGFDELLFKELDRLGTVTAYRELAELSRMAVIDLRQQGANDPAFDNRERRESLDGCVVIRPAVRR